MVNAKLAWNTWKNRGGIFFCKIQMLTQHGSSGWRKSLGNRVERIGTLIALCCYRWLGTRHGSWFELYCRPALVLLVITISLLNHWPYIIGPAHVVASVVEVGHSGHPIRSACTSHDEALDDDARGPHLRGSVCSQLIGPISTLPPGREFFLPVTASCIKNEANRQIVYWDWAEEYRCVQGRIYSLGSTLCRLEPLAFEDHE